MGIPCRVLVCLLQILKIIYIYGCSLLSLKASYYIKILIFDFFKQTSTSLKVTSLLSWCSNFQVKILDFADFSIYRGKSFKRGGSIKWINCLFTRWTKTLIMMRMMIINDLIINDNQWLSGSTACAIFLVSKIGTFGKSGRFWTKKNGTSSGQIKILRPLL